MTLARFNPYPVQWYEGMFLVPQHFQQADLRQQNLWHYHLSRMAPYYWGVVNVVIDAAQLVNGFLSILSLEAILPDGTILFFPDSPTEKLSLSLADLPNVVENEPFKIYLCIPASDQEGFYQTDDASRYLSIESTPVKDMNTGDSSVSITHLKPRLSLVVGHVPSRSTALPLVEIVRSGKKFSQTNFLPPQVAVPLESPLGMSCLGLTKRVRDKLIYLQSKIHNTLSEAGAEGARMSTELEAIRQHLVVGLLTFESILNTNTAHPYELFKGLSVLIAHGLALKRGQYPPAFTPYQHDDLEACFDQLFVFFDDVLNTIEESYVSIIFTQKERVYSLELHPEYIPPNTHTLVFSARAQPGATEDDLVRWVQEAVIATDSFIDRVQENRVLGAERQIVNAVSSLNLTPSRGMVLFTVVNDQRFISSGEFLRIFNISDAAHNRPQQMTFYLPNTTS